MHVRRTDVEISKKYIAKALIIVLSRVDGRVLAVLIKDLQDQAKPYDLRPCAKDS